MSSLDTGLATGISTGMTATSMTATSITASVGTVDWTQATLIAYRDLSDSVREFQLRPATPHAAWSLGSHLRVQVRHADGRLDERRYSLVGLPQAGADWRIAVKRVSPSRGGSAFMGSLQAGDVLLVQPPRNHFELPWAAPQTQLLAGGIGITPLLGMALALAARKADVRLAYTARDAQDLVYADELRAALGDRLHTQTRAEGGRMNVAALIAALHPQAQMLVCGPVAMLQSVQAAWAAAGRAPQRLRFETFGSSGHEVAETFWVEVPRHKLRFEVPPDRSMLEMLHSHGVQVLHDCVRGECGLCATEVLNLQGRIDHRDVFFSADEKAANTKLCTCVSRVVGGGVVIDSAYRPEVAAL